MCLSSVQIALKVFADKELWQRELDDNLFMNFSGRSRPWTEETTDERNR